MTHISDALVRRLRKTTAIDEHDIEAIERLPIIEKDFPAHASIVAEGERPTRCCLLIEGFAARSKTTDRGKRQVLSIHIPGEIPDLQSLHLHVMDHDMTTLSPVRAGFIPHDALRDLTRERPSIASALWRDTLVDAAIFREWIVNVRRPGPSRMAHLIVEMQSRLELIGRATKETFHLPMTQIDLADALGLTPVHVNRVLQELRKEGVLDFRNNVVTTSNLARLRVIGDFDPLYLHQAPSM